MAGGGRIAGQKENAAGLVEFSTSTISAARTGGTWAAKYGRRGGVKGDADITHWDVAPPQNDFNQMFRVSKNQIIWGGNYFGLPPTRCFNVWKKLTISESFTMAMAEYAWTSFNDNAKIWEFAPQDPARFHPTQKPIGLIIKQLELYSQPGDLILDPYSGSGTTAVACHITGRRFICIESDRFYYEKSVERLTQAQRQQSLF